MRIYDATFYAGKPASDVLTYSNEHFTPCLAGCSPIVLTGVGAFGHNWIVKGQPAGTPASMDRATFRKFADALPQGATVCLDIEGDDDNAITATLVYALRSGRARRPDCTWGHYEGHDRYAAFEGAVIKDLFTPAITKNQRTRAAESQFIAQEIYPRRAIPKAWPEYQPIDRAQAFLHITWSALACQRWRDIGKPVYALVTGTLHTATPTAGVPLSAEQVAWQGQVGAKCDAVVMWDGADWTPAGAWQNKVLPFNPRGRWTGSIIAEVGRAVAA